MENNQTGMEPKGLNKDYMIASYQNQLIEASQKIAERDAIIEELVRKEEERKKKDEENQKKLKEMVSKVDGVKNDSSPTKVEDIKENKARKEPGKKDE